MVRKIIKEKREEREKKEGIWQGVSDWKIIDRVVIYLNFQS